MKFERLFVPHRGTHYHGLDFVERESVVRGKDGQAIPGRSWKIWVPAGWSQTAVDMLAQKYCRKAGVPDLLMPVAEKGVPDWLWPSAPAPEAKQWSGEHDARMVFHRLAGCWTYWAWRLGYFSGLTHQSDAHAFYEELCHLLATQAWAPASPQWFNTGLHWAYGIEGPANGQWALDFDESWSHGPVAGLTRNSYEHPQAHACYIQSVKDTLLGQQGITSIVEREARVFKFGGGSGANFSDLRGKYEPLSGGGFSSGLLGWLKILDRGAGAIKSGGTTRRAAKMIILDVDHPDIEEFIDWKVTEEDKVAELIIGAKILAKHVNAILYAYHETPNDGKGDAAVQRAISAARRDFVPERVIKRVLLLAQQGVHDIQVAEHSADFEGDGYGTVSGQNGNNSVRLCDKFMAAVRADSSWSLLPRTGGNPTKVMPARELWNKIVYAAWSSADPGVHFADTVNAWNTCPQDGEIRATNPCQPGFATILTPNGIRSMNDIEVGTVIWSGEKWVTVTNKWATGIKPVFRYHTRAGCFVGTTNHRVFSDGQRVEVDQAETIDICPRKGTKYESISYDDRQLNQRDFVAGLTLGDGGLKTCNDGKNKYKLLYIGTKDSWMLSHSFLSGVLSAKAFDGKAYRVDTDLTEEELSRKTFEREIPRRYLQGDSTTVRSFLCGLYAANGSICGDRVTLKAASLQVILSAQEMLSSLGIRSYYTVNKPTLVTFANGEYLCKQSYDLNITADKDIFRERIGFQCPEKQCHLEEACKKNGAAKKNSYEVVEKEYLGDLPVYDITINDETHCYWTGGLKVSNCSEFIWLDDSGCNLASINLCSFYDREHHFDTAAFEHVVRLVTTVLDITVSMAGYPSQEIAVGSGNYRTLGLGYCNLGALLMRMGLPYDSDDGRYVAAVLSNLMTCRSYLTSAELAETLGAFPRYQANKEDVLRVLNNHAAVVCDHLDPTGLSYPLPRVVGKAEPLVQAAWDTATWMLKQAARHGVRNAQVTLLAPTGTIGLLMDADTTGIEPDFSLVKWKQLAGGGYIKIVNQSVVHALERLGYEDHDITDILRYLNGSKIVDDHALLDVLQKAGEDSVKWADKLKGIMDVSYILPKDHGASQEQIEKWNKKYVGHMTLEGAPALKPEHLAVFDCANRCGKYGQRFLSWRAHVDMMAVVQPSLSGGISKTVNLPHDASLETVAECYLYSHARGVKCNALYRDGCKLSQPLSSGDDDLPPVDPADPVQIAERIVYRYLAKRRQLPSRRNGYTQKLKLGGHKFYMRTGEYLDGTLGEVFLDSHTEGSFTKGVLNALAIAISLGLQHGVPLQEFVEAYESMNFEPSGPVEDHPFIKAAPSLPAAIVRDLAFAYLGRTDMVHTPDGHPQETTPVFVEEESAPVTVPVKAWDDKAVAIKEAKRKGYEGTPCPECKALTLVRDGKCTRCDTCGSTTGCS